MARRYLNDGLRSGREDRRRIKRFCPVPQVEYSSASNIEGIQHLYYTASIARPSLPYQHGFLFWGGWWIGT